MAITPAAGLNALRENWLNPPDLVQRVPEVVPTAEQREAGAGQIYPDRILPADEKAAAILKKRTSPTSTTSACWSRTFADANSGTTTPTATSTPPPPTAGPPISPTS